MRKREFECIIYVTHRPYTQIYEVLLLTVSNGLQQNEKILNTTFAILVHNS